MVGEKDTGTNSTLWTVLAGLGIEHKDPKYLPLQFTRGLKDLKSENSGGNSCQWLVYTICLIMMYLGNWDNSLKDMLGKNAELNLTLEFKYLV